MSKSLYWNKRIARAAVIVAHPDDETLWAGGAILSRPRWKWTIVTLCRGSDTDRAPKFSTVLGALGAVGQMEDVDDGPDQTPLAGEVVREAVRSVLPDRDYDVILTHSPFGEYTRHRRHEEVSEAVTELWETGEIETGELWLFAYEDSDKKQLPRVISRAPLVTELIDTIWRQKQTIIETMYGFASDSWEARTNPRSEAFWCFSSPAEYHSWRNAEEGAR